MPDNGHNVKRIGTAGERYSKLQKQYEEFQINCVAVATTCADYRHL